MIPLVIINEVTKHGFFPPLASINFIKQLGQQEVGKYGERCRLYLQLSLRTFFGISLFSFFALFKNCALSILRSFSCDFSHFCRIVRTSSNLHLFESIDLLLQEGSRYNGLT